MAVFKDSLERVWEVNLNISSSRPLAAYLKTLDPPVDLFNPTEFYAYTSIVYNSIDALSIICRKQREALGVSEEQFGEALFGKFAFEAQRALNEEYLNFYPDPEMSEILKNAQIRLNESSKKEEQLIALFLGQVADNYEKRVSQLTNSLSSSTSQDSPEKEKSEPVTGE